MESSNNHSDPLPGVETVPTRGSVITQGNPRPVHGAITPAELRRLGLNSHQVLDFSASISPLGPPQGVWEALRQVDLTAYPDPACLEMREALSRSLGVPVEQILVGNGSTELIHLLTRAYLSPPPEGTSNSIFLLTPTYGEYEGAGRLQNAQVSRLNAYYSDGFRWDIQSAQEQIAARKPSLIFVCNPNNPTGVYLQEPNVRWLAEAAAEAGALLVLDEAYLSFVDHPWDSLSLLKGNNVVLLRSMTKDYALTGLRLGYSLASEEVTARLASFQPDWSVNGLAQAAGLAALSDTEYLSRSRAAVSQSKEYLTEHLESLGLMVMPSSANFLLVQVGNGTLMRERLIRRGLVLRDCASFGLPDCIRIGLRSLADCERLVRAMEEII
jgi:histidinol-phosphate aminotransferase